MNKYEDALDDICCECNSFEDKRCYIEKVWGEKCESYITLKELVDKETPKKVKKKIKAVSPIHDIVIGTCLNCGEEDLKENCNYCSNCGQRLEWK